MTDFLQKRIFFFLFTGISAVIFLIFTASFAAFLMRPIHITQPRTIEIQTGKPFNSIVKQLYDSQLITDQQKFKILAGIFNASKKIRAGEYEFKGDMSPYSVLKILLKGIIKQYSIVIPEGFTVKQIFMLLSANGIGKMKRFIELGNDNNFLKEAKLESNGLEGYLFPDTYIFHKNMKEEEIILKMVQNFNEKTKNLTAETSRLNMNFKDIVILASIIQKETFLNEEMPLVSAVFHNRINKKIPLQADPTVIYSIPDFTGNILKRDMKIKSPYNTYIYRGLPPGPISNPGFNAINAAMHPADASYLYFVSRNDGTHEFSKTLKEHNRFVDIYQKKRKKTH